MCITSPMERRTVPLFVEISKFCQSERTYVPLFRDNRGIFITKFINKGTHVLKLLDMLHFYANNSSYVLAHHQNKNVMEIMNSMSDSKSFFQYHL